MYAYSCLGAMYYCLYTYFIYQQKCSCSVMLLGQFHLKDEDFLPAITGDTPLEYLIPTASGAGVLTTALVDYLIRTHNAFIDRCCSLVEQKRDG